MGAPRKIFLYFLTDTTTGKSFYYIINGTVRSTATPTALEDDPDGWLDTEVSFARSQKYYGINRTFTIPLKFTGDGAKIIRKHLYTGKGIEAPLSLIITKWDESSDIYRLYYKGELDLSQVTDVSAESIQVNLMEGGIVKLLKSFENTTYQVPCDGSIPENVQVRIDGFNFQDTFTYQVNDYDLRDTYALSCAFISNTGDNIGIEKGDQSAEEVPNAIADYVATSANYIFSSQGATTLNISGEISVTCESNPNFSQLIVAFFTSSNAQYNIINEAMPLAGFATSGPFNIPVSLGAGEKLFLILYAHPGQWHINQSSFTIDFFSRLQPTTCWGIKAGDLFRLLVQQIGNNLYDAQSALLDSWQNFVVTCGFSLRGDAGAVIKTSLSDFFQSFNAILGGSLSNINTGTGNDKLFFEQKEYVFDASAVTMDVGEVSEFSVSVATDYFFNTLKIGYPPQTYDEKTGQSEYNTTYQWKAPLTRIQKELDLTSKYRADSNGVEYTRLLFGGKSTTNNSSDNDVFILNVDISSQNADTYSAATQSNAQYNPNGNVAFDTAFGSDQFSAATGYSEFTFNGIAQYVDIDFSIAVTKPDGSNYHCTLFRSSDNLQTIIPPGNGSTQSFSLKSVLVQPGDVIRVFLEYAGVGDFVMTVNAASLTISLTSMPVYGLKRVPYDSVSGVPDPATAYNIEGLTPKRMLINHEKFLRSTLYNLQPGQLEFQSTDKNPNLSTSRGAVVYTENANVPVSSLSGQLFYPFLMKFKTKVPVNFADLMNGAANGHIKFSFNGKTFYGFPMEVTAKPALEESQEWTLLPSTLTHLADLQDLEIDGLNYFDLMGYETFIPHLCPVQFVPLNGTMAAQYHNVSMDSDWFSKQIKAWSEQKNYFQPWQTDDIISIQVQTNGLGPAQLQLIDCNNQVLQTEALAQITTSSLQGPRALFQGDISLEGLDEDIYYLLLTVGLGSAVTQFISEPLWVKADWPETLLFEYKHRSNKQSTIFSEGYFPSLRVGGWFDNFMPQAKFAVHEDQPADIELLNGIPYRTYKLNIGTDDGVPNWVIDKVNRILLLSTVKIDGVPYSRDADAKFEAQNVPGNPKQWWTIDVREAYNREGVTMNTDGQLDDNVTVVYNIDTKGFGDGDSGSNIVQVIKID